jgi:diguanylate cyclase (GGDEF)-like protein
MIDIDYFKKVNDACGHQCGDFILQQIAAISEKNIKIEDTLASYVGEEFCCLLPETSIERATRIAERNRVIVEK